MFCDITKIRVEAGNGGGGCLSLLREKFMAKGGPDGGDGGLGGSVIIKASGHLNSLIELHTKKIFKARPGGPGGATSLHGANGEDCIIEVPVGTQIKEIITHQTTVQGKIIEEQEVSEEILYDLTQEGQEFVVVQGGRGGYGNEHFKSSIRRTPRFAELGEPGEKKDIQLELKLVADIGIIGLPSAGKSTLISVLTAARPKIADYPFTTLIPNLGVMKVREESLVIADIPGLIEGASEGRGLGDEFLRHISRNSVLVHVIDANAEDVFEAYQIVQKELAAYSQDLAYKKQIVVFNKIDTQDSELAEMMKQEFYEKLGGQEKPEVFSISAINRWNLDPLKDAMYKMVVADKAANPHKIDKVEETEGAEIKLYTPLEEESPRYFEIEDCGTYKDVDNNRDPQVIVRRVFKIHGKRINQIAIMTNFDQRDGVDRLWDIFKKLGIRTELEELGATEESRITFARFDKKIHMRERL